jgi:hypothetical protein
MYELYDNFSKGIDLQSGPFVTQDYVLSANDWSKTDQVCNALMGSTASVGGIGGTVVRTGAFRCPTSPNLSCIDAVCVGEGENVSFDGGHVKFNLPKIRAKYGIRSWEQLATEDPGGLNSFPNDAGGPYTYAEMSIDFQKTEQKIPGSAYAFYSPAAPCDVPFSRRIGTAKLTFTRKRVPYLPTLKILSLLNNLNDATFFGAPRGQILFAGARTTKVWESDGTILQDVSLEFHYQEFNWNFLIHPKTGNPQIIYQVQDGSTTLYPYADLRPLLLS